MPVRQGKRIFLKENRKTNRKLTIEMADKLNPKKTVKIALTCVHESAYNQDKRLRKRFSEEKESQFVMKDEIRTDLRV
ncbi:hypothetical protein RB620_19995 [Paenibacillus sp. LHD-117]|uniref:hypothetical protein n=1 Tax=Paenibacillus sp. LHD-117 TaxID=3071412 RepID=UPI0027E14585|nr:hypothetical protein [Paenibacillus sp. LHD-117]MDQ6421712.1 hypothetical protein [Paenibacillus sp. LHD-117]